MPGRRSITVGCRRVHFGSGARTRNRRYTILAATLLKMGRFYELFEMDAHVGAKELDLQYMRSIFFGNMETCLVVSIGNTKLQILSMEIEFETILSICQKRNHKPVSDDPLGDARNKVQEKIRKEYCNDGEWHHPRKRGCKACDQEGDAKI
ncbi:DNA mismatch repair protein MSH6, partial [Tanacetum coccineum]